MSRLCKQKLHFIVRVVRVGCVLLIALSLPGRGMAEAEKPLRWYGYVYGGKAVSDSFIDIHTGLYSVESIDSNIVAVGVGKELYHYKDYVTFEGEGQVARYVSGINDHTEFNTAATIRWQPFPWDRWLDTSLAWGAGLSYATSTPEVEKLTADDVNRLLFYMLAEVEVMVPTRKDWSLFTRTHHRSSALGLISGSDAASNTLVLGVKKRF